MDGPKHGAYPTGQTVRSALCVRSGPCLSQRCTHWQNEERTSPDCLGAIEVAHDSGIRFRLPRLQVHAPLPHSFARFLPLNWVAAQRSTRRSAVPF